MFNFATIMESVRRRWLIILVVTVVALAAGFGSAILKSSSQQESSGVTSYTAEAVIYFQVNENDASMSASYANDFLLTDARRTVLNDSVAGEVRRTYGEDIQVTTPFWMDTQKDSRYTGHYVFVDVSAPSKEIALDAANMAADLAAGEMQRTLPINRAIIVDEAYITPSSLTAAADRGSEELTVPEDIVIYSSSISKKSLFIFGFVGLFGSIFVCACYDILSRRVRSAKDIERMTDISVLATLRSAPDFARAASCVDVLMKRNDLNSVVVAGICEKDDAKTVGTRIAENMARDCRKAIVLDDPDAASRLLQADSVLLVFAAGACSGEQLDAAMRTLRVANVPVLGAVFVPKK